MSSTTPLSVSPYRPVLFLLAGAAAAAVACLLLSTTFQTSSGNGLQRSNAVRRRGRRRDSPSAPALSLSSSIARSAHEMPSLGVYNLLGTPVSLEPHNLVSPLELQALIAQRHPNASQEAVDSAIADLYDVFLDRLLALLFPARPPSTTEIEAVRTWLGHRVPDDTAVTRAAERHAASFLLGQLPATHGADSVAATDPSGSLRSDEGTEFDPLDPDGQTLQRTLYHIAEDRARQEGVIHRGITCNGCDEKPIRGIRWHCANCVDFDLCSNCEATNSHYKTHIFYKIPVPAPYLGLPKQEPLYPGKPHMMSPSIEPSLRKRLVTETKMETEEIEALWDQFSCLAGTEWVDDPSKVGWALDRRAFNHAFVPRYNSFVAAPNLIYDRIFAYYDTDKNDLIGFDEWIKGIDGMHTNDVQVKARIVFNGYDIDGDGYVSRKDILRIFRAFYAIEKEATRNYVAELTEDMSVRNALDTIRSSQPLGSAFPPNNMVASNTQGPGLRTKPQDDDSHAIPVLKDSDTDVAGRDDILRATHLRNVMPGEMTQSEQDRIIADRWARREFYIDQEEGLTRPEGIEDTEQAGEESNDQIEPNDGSNTISGNERPRWSRSSSRVRFQDDVDAETRSNASTSSRPIGERWGGYEIPEPEKDLGKEVLYQITQQGFNELLNPLFQDKEDMAMDAHSTRSERRKNATYIKETVEKAEASKADIEAILQIGIFRFSKCMIDMFCKALNNGSHYGSFRDIFQDENGKGIEREAARLKLARIYESIECELISAVKPSNTTNRDKMALWNTALCRFQLQSETLDAVLDCVSYLGWLIYPITNGSANETRSSVQATTADRDPTLPQFRPNSLADVDTTRISPRNSASFDDELQDTDELSKFETEEIVVYRTQDGVEHIASDPQGPFFAFTVPEIKPSNSEEDGELKKGKDGSSSPPPHAILIIPAEESVSTEESSRTAATSRQDGGGGGFEPKPDVKYRSYTHDPTIHLLFVDSSSGVDVLRSSPRPVTHSNNPYQPELDPLKPLVRYVRQLAMEPSSRLHPTMLASLETVEQEISDRKGSGLVSFDEFAEHMREGRLRFLESWMEWVSI